MRLYRLRYSTNVERVTLALAAEGLAVQSFWVEAEDRRLGERVSGQSLVPVLEEARRVIAGSTAILRYLEERYPEPPLYPRAEARRTRARALNRLVQSRCQAPGDEIEADLLRGRADGAASEARPSPMGLGGQRTPQPARRPMHISSKCG